jgi:hypothetical protein
MDVGWEVIAPSLIPERLATRPETDRRDCRRLARLHRAGELVAIRVPTVGEEAVRDRCRTRADMVQDLTRARNRLGKFLLRHGGRGGVGRPGPTPTRRGWFPAVRPAGDDPDVPPLPGGVEVRNQALTRWSRPGRLVWRPPFDWQVARLAAYRGITRLAR